VGRREREGMVEGTFVKGRLAKPGGYRQADENKRHGLL